MNRDEAKLFLTDVLGKVRRNHALEHATVAVLLEKGAMPPLGGYSIPGGFFIFGRVSPEAMSHAILEAYDRLMSGEHQLAISPYCGTNLATGMAISSIASALIMRAARGRVSRSPLLTAATIGGVMLSRPLGSALQKRYTVQPDISGMEVADIKPLKSGPFAIYKVNTRFREAGQRPHTP